jgi:hypothetical protein
MKLRVMVVLTALTALRYVATSLATIVDEIENRG